MFKVLVTSAATFYHKFCLFLFIVYDFKLFISFGGR